MAAERTRHAHVGQNHTQEEKEKSDREAGYSQPPSSAPQRRSHYHREKSSLGGEARQSPWSFDQVLSVTPPATGPEEPRRTEAAKKRSASRRGASHQRYATWIQSQGSTRHSRGQGHLQNHGWNPPKWPGQEGEERDRRRPESPRHGSQMQQETLNGMLLLQGPCWGEWGNLNGV